MSYHLSPPASQAGGGYSSVEPSENDSDSSIPDRDDEIDLLSANSHGQAGGHVLHHHRRRKSSAVPEDPVVAAESAGAGGVQHGIRHLKDMVESGLSLLPAESAESVEARRRLVPDTKWKLYDPQPFLSHILHPQSKTEDATPPAHQHQHKPHDHHHHHHQHHKQDPAMAKSAPSSRAGSWISQKSPVYDKAHYTFSPARENFECFLHGGRSSTSNKPTATDSVSSLGSEEQESESIRQSVGSESSGDESDDSDVSVRPRRLERRSSTFYEDATRRASETASALHTRAQTRAQEVSSAMDAIQSKIANFHLNVHSRASEEEEKSYGPSERATAETEKSYGPRERGGTETAPKYAHFDDAHYSRDSLVRRRTRVGGSHSGKFEEEESVAEQKDAEREEEAEEEQGYEFQSRKSVAAGPASVGEVKVLPREVEQDLLRRKSAEDEEAVVHAAAGASSSSSSSASSLGMSKVERRVSEWKPAPGLEGRRTMSFDYNDYRKQFHGPLMTPEEEKRPGFSSRDAE
ncbi:hypothetical protein BZA70DRAFT_283365 [Myxozyma melibiosi]|uniref:Uncharacterized protein n=1 Tax=Myxozyma melibiosi TaxID=54550 RepID=A0ABR1F0D5_9ASCO